MSPLLRLFDEEGETVEKHPLIIAINSSDDPEKRMVWLAPKDDLQIKENNIQIEIQFEELFKLIAKALRRTPL